MTKPKPDSRTISVSNSLSNSEKLVDFLTDAVDQHDLPRAIVNDLRLVIDEAFTNIISYAYTDRQAHTITMEIVVLDDSIRLTFRDSGIAFNPLQREAFSEDQDHSLGGMGIHLIKSLTDSQHYQRSQQCNELTIIKNYSRD